MVLNVHRNHKVYLGTGRKGEGGGMEVGGGGGEREIIYLSLHYHHQNDFCITETAICEGQSHKTVSTDHNV